MKITKRELIKHLEQYPDDYAVDLSHYFLVDVSDIHEEPRFFNAMFEIPIRGTAADEENKLIKFILDKAHEDVLTRISKGEAPILHPRGNKDSENDIEAIDDDVEEQSA